MSMHLHPAIEAADQTIFREGESGSTMFFIYKGVVNISSMHRRPGEVHVVVADGCYFGDVAVLCHCTRTATAKAKTNTIMYSISRKHLRAVVEGHDDIKQYLLRVAHGRQLRVAQVGVLLL
jgi:CRP-like cAMP-binding protein